MRRAIAPRPPAPAPTPTPAPAASSPEGSASREAFALIQGAAVQVPGRPGLLGAPEMHGFRPLEHEALPHGVAVTWWANEAARYIVIHDELRITHGGAVPRAIVFIEPGAGASQAAIDEAERSAVELGAVKVTKLPAREKGMGGAPEAPQGPDVTLREAVDLALEKIPADVREGARRRTDQFLSLEKV